MKLSRFCKNESKRTIHLETSEGWQCQSCYQINYDLLVTHNLSRKKIKDWLTAAETTEKDRILQWLRNQIRDIADDNKKSGVYRSLLQKVRPPNMSGSPSTEFLPQGYGDWVQWESDLAGVLDVPESAHNAAKDLKDFVNIKSGKEWT